MSMADRGRLLVLIDGDGQHKPEDIPKLLAAATDYHMVVGARAKGSKLRFHRYAANVAYNLFASYVTRFKVKDLTSGFRFYNARACRLLASEEATLLDYQDIGVLLLLRHARLRIAEVSVAMNPRGHGASRVFSSWWTVGVYMAETTLLCLARWNQDGTRRRITTGQAN